MPYGSLITTLGADWKAYKADLERAYKELEAFHQKTQRLATTTLRTAGGGGGAGRAASSGSVAGSVDAQFRYIESQRQAAEQGLRRFYASWDKAEQENQRRVVVSNKEKQAAFKKVLSDEQELRRFYGSWDAAERENQRRVIMSNKEKQAALKKALAAERELLRFYDAWDNAEKENLQRVAAAEKQKAEAVKASLAQQLGEVKANNAKLNALAAEEMEKIKARQKLIAQTAADFEKEFQRPSQGIFRDAGKDALSKARLADDLEKTEAKLKNIGEIHLPKINQAMTQFRQAVRVTAGYAAAIGTTSLVGGFALLAKEALSVNIEYERNRQVIAQILGMTSQWVNSQGKAVDQSRQLNLNYAEADKLLPQIRDQAAKLNLTFEEAANVFRTGFGLALQRGINPEQAVPIIGQITELAKALGAGSMQAQLREVRALLAGIRPGTSRIATALGLDPAAMKQARESGHMLEYLNGVFQRGKPYLDKYENSWEVLSTTLISRGQELLRLSTEKTFEKLTGSLADFNRQIDDPNKIRVWAETISQSLAAIISISKEAIQSFQSLSRAILPSFVREAPGAVLGAAIARQQDAASGRALAGTRREIAATTGGGMTAAIVAQRQKVRIAQSELMNSMHSPFGAGPTVPQATQVYNYELDQLKKLEDQEKRFTQAHKNELGKRSGDQLEALHLQVLQHHQALETQNKEALYLAKLRTKDQDDDIHKIHAKLSEEILASQKVVKSVQGRHEAERLLRDRAHKDLLDKLEEQRLDSQQVIAEELGDKKTQAQIEAQLAIKKTNDDVEDEKLKAERIAAIKQGLAQKLKEIDQEFQQKAREDVKQYQEAIRKEAEERRSLAKETGDLEKQTGRELVNLAKEREQAIKDLYRTQAEESLKARQSEIDTSRQSLRNQARTFLERSGAFAHLGDQLGPVRQQAEEDARQRFRMNLAGSGTGNVVSFTPAQLAEQDRLAKAAGNEAVTNASRVTQENMITRAIQTNQFGLGGVAANLDNKQTLLTAAGERQSVAERANDVGKASELAQKRVVDLALQQVQVIENFKLASKQIKEHFNKDLQELHETFTKLAPEFKKLLQEIQASHGVIPPALRAVLQRGTVAPSQGQIAGALGGAPGTISIHLTGGDDPALERALGRILQAHGLRAFIK